MPTEQPAKILVIDDEAGMADLLTRIISAEGHSVERVLSAEDAEVRLSSSIFDLVLTDMVLKGKGGDHIVRIVKERWPETEVIVITAHASIDSAIEIMKLGAFDYLRKPLLPEEILHTVRRALEVKGLRDEVRILRKEKETHLLTERIIGRSPAMRRLVDVVMKVSRTDATVLLEGESGTGKEIFARAIHDNSQRAKGPFIAVNCGAIPGELLETELFGHIRGAFTGATREREGYFESANGGTLLLDEIGEMEPRLQVKLLRVLQEGSITRVGENKPRPVDVRIIASTNKRLSEEVNQGSFRRDLYYRLHVVHIEIPPLRERREDILPLAHGFMRRYAEKYGKRFQEIDPRACILLQRHDYPGNIRELENIMESAVAIGSGRIIRPAHIKDATGPEAVGGSDGHGGETDLPYAEALENVVDLFDRNYLVYQLKKYGGRIVKVVNATGLSRRTLERKMKKYNLARASFLPGDGGPEDK